MNEAGNEQQEREQHSGRVDSHWQGARGKRAKEVKRADGEDREGDHRVDRDQVILYELLGGRQQRGFVLCPHGGAQALATWARACRSHTHASE